MPPRVSILIPVYNARQWVGAAIECALAQTCPDTEVIVLDDGSTDGSSDVVRQYGSRARIVQQANGGQNVSRNRLTSLSSAEWLVYLDADDALAPDAVARKLDHAATADAIFGTMELQHFRDGELQQTEIFPAADYDDPFAAGFYWKYPNTSAFMFRRSAVLDAGGWNESIRSCTDYDLYFRLLLARRRFKAAPESRSVYRHWSRAQASREDAVRQTVTRLEVMWRAAHELDRASRWTDQARVAFANAAFGVIRILHTVDADRAAAEYDRLHAWQPQFQPASARFSSTYRAAFRLLGFRGAERIADATRALRPRPLPIAERP